MPNASTAGSGLSGAIARLDQDIVEAERHIVEAQRHLDELRAMRASIEPFIEQYISPAGIASEGAFGSPTVSTRTSLTDQVVDVFVSDPDAVLEVDDVIYRLGEAGVDAKPPGIRNALYYAARLKKLEKKGRGRFTLRNTSAPAATGADV